MVVETVVVIVMATDRVTGMVGKTPRTTWKMIPNFGGAETVVDDLCRGE